VLGFFAYPFSGNVHRRVRVVRSTSTQARKQHLSRPLQHKIVEGYYCCTSREGFHVSKRSCRDSMRCGRDTPQNQSWPLILWRLYQSCMRLRIQAPTTHRFGTHSKCSYPKNYDSYMSCKQIWMILKSNTIVKETGCWVEVRSDTAQTTSNVQVKLLFFWKDIMASNAI
jgi:hypothetical protein